ncbi:MAG: hypothetical protein AUK33_10455 [Flavobacteriaceae bacterium CG2_30_34_30]|nr:MAG: hypothetical protein AUK33_10455 [Flavobacteriaceae bacterium CG2_30_34_30]
MGSNSVSTNEREEAIFKAQEFRSMSKGQFIGFTADCDAEIFRGTVFPIKVEPKEIDDIKNLSEADLLENFKKIIAATKQAF